MNVALPDLARGVRGRRLRDWLDDHQQLSALRQPAPARRARRRPAQSAARLLRRLSVFTAASLASARAVSSTALFAARTRQGSARRGCRQHRSRSSRRASGARSGRERSATRTQSAPPAPPSASCSAASAPRFRLARDLLHQPAGRCWRRADRAKRRACRSARTPRRDCPTAPGTYGETSEPGTRDDRVGRAARVSSRRSLAPAAVGKATAQRSWSLARAPARDSERACAPAADGPGPASDDLARAACGSGLAWLLRPLSSRAPGTGSIVTSLARSAIRSYQVQRHREFRKRVVCGGFCR